jgi:hypothetical protein
MEAEQRPHHAAREAPVNQPLNFGQAVCRYSKAQEDWFNF